MRNQDRFQIFLCLFVISVVMGAIMLGLNYNNIIINNNKYNATLCVVTEHRIDQFNGYQATCYVGYVTYTVFNYGNTEIKINSEGCYKKSQVENILREEYPLNSEKECFAIFNIPNEWSIKFALDNPYPSLIIGIIFLSLSAIFLSLALIFVTLTCISNIAKKRENPLEKNSLKNVEILEL